MLKIGLIAVLAIASLLHPAKCDDVDSDDNKCFLSKCPGVTLADFFKSLSPEAGKSALEKLLQAIRDCLMNNKNEMLKLFYTKEKEFTVKANENGNEVTAKCQQTKNKKMTIKGQPEFNTKVTSQQVSSNKIIYTLGMIVKYTVSDYQFECFANGESKREKRTFLDIFMKLKDILTYFTKFIWSKNGTSNTKQLEPVWQERDLSANPLSKIMALAKYYKIQNRRDVSSPTTAPTTTPYSITTPFLNTTKPTENTCAQKHTYFDINDFGVQTEVNIQIVIRRRGRFPTICIQALSAQVSHQSEMSSNGTTCEPIRMAALQYIRKLNSMPASSKKVALQMKKCLCQLFRNKFGNNRIREVRNEHFILEIDF